jgi:hypothetical protein
MNCVDIWFFMPPVYAIWYTYKLECNLQVAIFHVMKLHICIGEGEGCLTGKMYISKSTWFDFEKQLPTTFREVIKFIFYFTTLERHKSWRMELFLESCY